MEKSYGYSTFAIVNPTAGSGRAAKRWSKMTNALFRSLGKFQHAFTSHPGHANELAEEALAAGYEMILAVGGDGTASEVAAAFFEGQHNRFPDTILAFIPLGTGCDLVRTLFPGCNLQKLCAGLGGRQYREIDVGFVRFVDRDGHDADRIFLNIASFGCGGAVARSVTATDKWLGSRIGFNLAAARTLVRHKDKAVSLGFDDGAPQHLSMTNVAVCNAQYFGGGMWVSPEAMVDDGELNVTVWSGFNLKDFLLKRRRLYDGTHLQEERTTVAKIKLLSADSVEQVFLEIDGEYVGQLPAAFQILPRSLKVKIQG